MSAIPDLTKVVTGGQEDYKTGNVYATRANGAKSGNNTAFSEEMNKKLISHMLNKQTAEVKAKYASNTGNLSATQQQQISETQAALKSVQKAQANAASMAHASPLPGGGGQANYPPQYIIEAQQAHQEKVKLQESKREEKLQLIKRYYEDTLLRTVLAEAEIPPPSSTATLEELEVHYVRMRKALTSTSDLIFKGVVLGMQQAERIKLVPAGFALRALQKPEFSIALAECNAKYNMSLAIPPEAALIMYGCREALQAREEARASTSARMAALKKKGRERENENKKRESTTPPTPSPSPNDNIPSEPPKLERQVGYEKSMVSFPVLPNFETRSDHKVTNKRKPLPALDPVPEVDLTTESVEPTVVIEESKDEEPQENPTHVTGSKVKTRSSRRKSSKSKK